MSLVFFLLFNLFEVALSFFLVFIRRSLLYDVLSCIFGHTEEPQHISLSYYARLRSGLKTINFSLVSVDLFGLKNEEENQLTTIIEFIHRYSGDGHIDDGNHDDHA